LLADVWDLEVKKHKAQLRKRKMKMN